MPPLITAPVYCCFFTAGTMYEQEARRLRASLERHGLPHDIRPVPDRGDWVKNTQLTAGFICRMLDEHPDRPIVYLDADAYVWSPPTLFDSLSGGADVAVHYRRGHELLNGTTFFNNTPGARLVAEKYREFIESNGGCTNEQLMLDAAIGACAELVTVARLPASYAWIHDIMAHDLGDDVEPVIEHLQASRERSAGPHCDAWGRRRKRLAEIEQLL
jgi:hypothetical protein